MIVFREDGSAASPETKRALPILFRHVAEKVIEGGGHGQLNWTARYAVVKAILDIVHEQGGYFGIRPPRGKIRSIPKAKQGVIAQLLMKYATRSNIWAHSVCAGVQGGWGNTLGDVVRRTGDLVQGIFGGSDLEGDIRRWVREFSPSSTEMIEQPYQATVALNVDEQA